MPSDPSSEDRRRLASVVKERREELRLTHEQVDRRGGPSTTTMSNIEGAKGAVPAERTLRKLDKALEWEDDSAWGNLHDGVPPTPKRSVPPLRAVDRDDAPVAVLPTVARVGGPLRSLLAARASLLEVNALIDDAIAKLRRGTETD